MRVVEVVVAAAAEAALALTEQHLAAALELVLGVPDHLHQVVPLPRLRRVVAVAALDHRVDLPLVAPRVVQVALGVLAVAAGAPRLLEVALERLGQRVVDDEADVCRGGSGVRGVGGRERACGASQAHRAC